MNQSPTNVLDESERGGNVATDVTAPVGSAVRVEGLWVWFPGQEAPKIVLKNVDLHVQERQFVSVVGASGCGKTTLLNAMAGSVVPGEGSVRFTIDGAPQNVPSLDIGYMFARDALLPWRSAKRNVELGLELRGRGRAERAERADDMLKLVGLGGHESKLPSELSQGMRQRANLARVLATRPRLLLLDEPFGALDAQTKATMQAEFLKIWETERTTVVFVTHDLTEAALLSDRVIVMRDGRIIEDITVPFARPRDLSILRFDAEFANLTHRLSNLISEES